MRFLVAAATEMELNGLSSILDPRDYDVSYMVHGVGLLQTSYHLSRLSGSAYDLLIQCGVAGTYTDDLQPGDAVLVYAEIPGDLGAEDHDRFLDVFELGLTDRNAFPFHQGQLVNEHVRQFGQFKAVNSLSVNCVAGKMSTIAQRKEHFNPDIETMEGAAFHYCCLMNRVPFVQVRGISNRVEPRNKENWQMAEAITASHHAVKNLIDHFILNHP